MAIQQTTIARVRTQVSKAPRLFYVGGQWVSPVKANDYEVINPATEEPIAAISLGSSADVDKAVAVASKAFDSYSGMTVGERFELLNRIVDIYHSRSGEMAETISAEMGAPISLSRAAQVPSGLAHFSTMVSLLKTFEFETVKGPTLLRKEPIGVCGLITPWNWPMNQICCKVAPALAAGCTIVLKPSEIAPLSACLLAEIFDEARVPEGVFNLINGDGPTVGAAIASHPAIAMVSFTGSTRAGVEVAKLAAPTVKRVTQELGGKSANIILDDADLQTAVRQGALACFRNSGQSCNAPTRMLVPRSKMADAATIAAKVAQEIRVGDPSAEATDMGPLASRAQYDKVQNLIEKGIDEGATLSAGGLGRPDGINIGYFAKPTVFSDVTNDMTIAREEIFGPVLCILAYDEEDDAISIANDSAYGLSAYVSSANLERAGALAKRIRAGNVHINYARLDFSASFGGYKQSGNGREWGEAGLNEFLELKSVFGNQ
ncbi:MAG TPA: aldehyde dehydrogenase family protein [Terriglobales bacterium]|nr:aldehyde dehydrogenase family protein [Terriglobales bacterium]